MKWIIGLVIIVVLVVGAVVFFMWPQMTKTGPEDIKMSLLEAQRVLGLVKRIEEASTDSGTFKEVSAVKTKGRFRYSPGWTKLNMPPLRDKLMFNFYCAVDGLCKAMEFKENIETGNGIGCDVASGEFQCYGGYKPVTTQGFDGTEIVVGCQAG